MYHMYQANIFYALSQYLLYYLKHRFCSSKPFLKMLVKMNIYSLKSPKTEQARENQNELNNVRSFNDNYSYMATRVLLNCGKS